MILKLNINLKVLPIFLFGISYVNIQFKIKLEVYNILLLTKEVLKANFFSYKK